MASDVNGVRLINYSSVTRCSSARNFVCTSYYPSTRGTCHGQSIADLVYIPPYHHAAKYSRTPMYGAANAMIVSLSSRWPSDQALRSLFLFSFRFNRSTRFLCIFSASFSYRCFSSLVDRLSLMVWIRLCSIASFKQPLSCS